MTCKLKLYQVSIRVPLVPEISSLVIRLFEKKGVKIFNQSLVGIAQLFVFKILIHQMIFY